MGAIAAGLPAGALGVVVRTAAVAALRKDIIIILLSCRREKNLITPKSRGRRTSRCGPDGSMTCHRPTAPILVLGPYTTYIIHRTLVQKLYIYIYT